MVGRVRAVNSHHFAALQENRAGTAAMRVPLVMWQDIVHGPEPQDLNIHHDFCSLYIVRQGRGTHVVDGVAYGVARGDVYAMGPGMRHHFEGCQDLTTDTLHFSPAIFDADALQALTETPGFYSLFIAEPLARAGSSRPAARAETRWLHLTPTQYAATQAALTELSAEWRSDAPISALLVRGLFLRLLVMLSRYYAGSGRCPEAAADAPQHAGAHEPTVAAAVHYLEANFHRPVRIEQVAARVYLSADRFTEVFAQAMGRTPRDYLRHLRVERARHLLATTDLPMAAVGEACGFAEPAYFTRVVRAATGMTPSELRRHARRP